MWKGVKDQLLACVSKGNRPLRILLFGGIFLAWLIMTILATVFGVETDIGNDIQISNIILIIISVLSGFGIAYWVFRFLEDINTQDKDR